MEVGHVSRTAIVTAMLRGAHHLVDDWPKILDDPFAHRFAGFSSDQEMLNVLNAIRFPDFLQMRTLFALRNRYAEDELASAIKRGTSQYVILGAGLDSFAYRRPDLLATLDVYEVDHPASQAWKRARIESLAIKVPPRLHYIPIDFERETLIRGLAIGGMSLNPASFFSWLGVTQYLHSAAVLSTLREIAEATAPGTEVVMQFIPPPATLTGKERDLVVALADHAAAEGEPWLSFFEPEQMEVHLAGIGFTKIRHFDHTQATERYLVGRGDGLRLPAYFHMLSACLE